MSYGVLPLPRWMPTVSDTAATTVTVVMALMALGALVFSLAHWRHSGRPTVLMMFLAGGAMMVLEPFVDIAGACWHPSDLARGFTLWNRPMPIWLCLTYFFYFGVGGGLTWLLLRKASTRRVLWGIFAAGVVGDVVLETVLLHWHIYVYYGSQPLVLLNFPLWWAPVNALTDVTFAAAVVRYGQRLQGMRQLLIIPLGLGISLAVNSIVGFPSWTAINSGFGDIGRDLSGLATAAIALVLMRLIVSVMTPAVSDTSSVAAPVPEPAIRS